ncbi:N-(5'-phosphoribosyl)anthranilate isomerase [archaeon SCG-AAA382B04]|nr:N-(5'-phosphoribosyl)anthranilate isomerase [archaeon SCG-AAA382B04]
MRLKICGITNKEDARIAEKYGAHGIGVVVNTSTKRAIELKRAREIFNSLGPYTKKVCVTEDASKRSIEQIKEIEPDAIQIYSDPEVQTDKYLVRGISGKDELDNIDRFDAILLDKSHGKGEMFPMEEYKKLIDKINKPVIVSGGITPHNIKMVVTKLSPYAIDVSSGIEKPNQKKDPKKIEKLIKRGINA